MSVRETRVAPDSAPIVAGGAGTLDRGGFLAAARALAGQLPECRYVLDLCERRELFMLTAFAAWLGGRTLVLPPNRAPETLARLETTFEGTARVHDADAVAALRSGDAGDGLSFAAALLGFSHAHIAVVPSTSGTTGAPLPHPKRWGSVLATSAHNEQSIRRELAPAHADALLSVIASVPAYHMYGFELSVLLPLLGDAVVHAGRPVLPADVSAALASMASPRVLVSTPVHLRALAASGIALPPLDLVVSATAPMDAALAAEIEQRFATRVLEMFGSTETCVFAVRRTAHEEPWRAYDGVRLEPAAEGTSVVAPWLDGPRVLQDVLETSGAGRFVHRGRSADLLEVGGKRGSLADLRRRLLAIPGVRDAEVLVPEEARAGAVQRVAAFVVAPDLPVEAIRARLADSIDPVFMPRPLVHVPELPRNAVGKAPREALLALLRRQ